MVLNSYSLFSASPFFLLCLIFSVFNHAQAEILKDSTKNSTLGSESRTSLLPAFNILAENFEFDEIQNCLPELVQHYVLNEPAKNAFEGFLKVLEDEPEVDKVLKYLSLSRQSWAGNGMIKSMKEVSLHLKVELVRLVAQFFDHKAASDSSRLHKVTWKILSFVSFQDFRQDVLHLVERDVGFSNFLSFLNNEEMADAYYRIKNSPQAQKLATLLHLQDGFSFDLHYDILGFFEEIIGWDSYLQDLNPIKETPKDRVVTLPELPAESEFKAESQDGGDDDLYTVLKWAFEPSSFDRLALDDEMEIEINRVKTKFRSFLSKMAGGLMKDLGLEDYKETVSNNIASWTDIFLYKIIFDGPILPLMAKFDLLAGLEVAPKKVSQEEEEDEEEGQDDLRDRMKPILMVIFRFIQSEVGSSATLKEMKEMLLDELIQIRSNKRTLIRLVEIVVDFHQYIGETFPWSDLTVDDEPRDLSVLSPLLDNLEKQYKLREEYWKLAKQNPDRFEALVQRKGRAIEMGAAYHRQLLMNANEQIAREYLALEESKMTPKEKILYDQGLQKLWDMIEGMEAEKDREDDPVKKYKNKTEK